MMNILSAASKAVGRYGRGFLVGRQPRAPDLHSNEKIPWMVVFGSL